MELYEKCRQARQGRLAELLEKHSNEELMKADIVLAAVKNKRNIPALLALIRRAGTFWLNKEDTILHVVGYFQEKTPHDFLQALCELPNAPIQALDSYGHSALHYFLKAEDHVSARIFFSHSIGLPDDVDRQQLTMELLCFRRGVIHCRNAVIAMIGVARRARRVDHRWDRFVIRKIAMMVWQTRTWQDEWISDSEADTMRAFEDAKVDAAHHEEELNKAKEKMDRLKRHLAKRAGLE